MRAHSSEQRESIPSQRGRALAYRCAIGQGRVD